MEWSQDFCLSCDNVNHTAGPYCSEACRLSDMDRSTEPDMHAALYSQSYSSTTSSAWGSSQSNRNSIISLQSGSYSIRSPITPAGSHPSSPSTAAFFASAQASSKPSSSRRHHSQSKRSLASSSSRSSLASINNAAHGLSDQTIAQLRYYTSSFDQSRDYKRRLT